MQRLVLLIFAFWLLACGPSNGETIKPLKAAVFRSTGTQFLGQTIWPELNGGWSQFGDVPVEIDWWSLAGYGITDAQLEATDADVIVLSNPAFVTYNADEIAALKRYVEAGHGLIISYGKFRSEDRALAPLVGLSSTTQAGTNTWPEPLEFELSLPTHPVFQGLNSPYISGVPALASPLPYGSEWQLTPNGEFLASTRPEYAGWNGNGVIVSHDSPKYRGLYFAHYPEALNAGTNQQDMQLFYNGLVWAATPEPATAILLLSAGLLVCRRRKS